MRLDFTATSFRFARIAQQAIAGDVAFGSAPRVRPQDSRPLPGGSISGQIMSPGLRRVGPWGFSILLSRLDDHAVLWHYGTSRQVPRRLSSPDTSEFVTAVTTEAVQQLERRDREAR